MSTLGQLKDKVLKLIAESTNNGVSIPKQKNADYLNRVIAIANDGLTEIVTTAKRKSKTIKISQNPIQPIGGLASGFDVVQFMGNDITNNVGLNATAYYFEVDNTATIYVEEENPVGVWNVLQTIQNTVKGLYTPYKGLINGTSGRNKRLRFSGLYTYNIKNVGLFNKPFETITDIPDYVPYKIYELPDDFYMLKDVKLESLRNITATQDFYNEAQKTLRLNYYFSNQIDINYYAYPTLIPDDATDDTIIDIDQLGFNVLAYYVASIVKNDEDVTMSTVFQNMYETKLARLMNQDLYSSSEVISINNW
jgi:hypothetical protein